MNDLRTAAQQALEALESVEWYGAGSGWMVDADAIEGAITALKAALAQQAESPCACWPGRMCSRQAQCAADVREQQAEPVRFLIEGNEFLGPPPAPYSTWGDALDSMIGARAIQGLRISALAQKPKPVQEICPGCEATLGAACGRESCPKGWEAAPPQQAEPVEPVAWRWGYRSVTTGEMDWRDYVEIAAHPNLRSPEIIMEPLYAAPPQRKPLTQDEIPALAEKAWTPSVYCDAEALLGTDGLVALVRAVEAKHGIKESP